ncbi:phosphatidylserine/phosphatidylglycerophosphate/cardiolipin synthase-like enzyme [Deinococcus yavapaiensis KR-236]|uniref:Phosphatidylserine/phosphatidylglycerophosphate/ cardiolipin synthase-like enzyme n=1 Tax=Deinococcus yavapaiensis KR-236 TaxID=694435 RepID=A0A318STD5_9DEIO|nr:phosphatidylserine/phosphatidylglycerophosphate/cardiolipin synthase-like enzyme [Deinococcus yavapaiensis KR-236]
MFVTSGSYPPRDGHSVTLLVDGEPAFRRICEAIEAARFDVWVTITFLWSSFRMPDGREALDVLECAAKRGVNVRVLFWRPDDETASLRRNAWWGSPEHFDELRRRGSPLHVRWDRAQGGFCQHQKSWLVDPGEDDGVAFVGGINLNPHSVVSPGHHGEGQNHDVYVEVRGPCVGDVAHNFVQRWNEASERRAADGHWNGEDELPFPARLPKPRGTATVQVQRTIHAGRVAHGRPPVDGAEFDIALGERSVLDGVLRALGFARRSIYVEQQYVEVLEVVEALHAACARGVEVVLVMPSEPAVGPDAYRSPERRAFLERRSALGSYANFTLCGLAGSSEDGRRAPVYVHAKLLLVDDVCAVVGSANWHRFSLFGNAELNVAIHDVPSARAFRVALFEEHLGEDTAHLDDLEALGRFKAVARANRERLARGDPAWQGLVFAADVARYGVT